MPNSLSDLLTEVGLISGAYDRIREERTFAIDDLEYDLFAAGWKACAEIAQPTKCSKLREAARALITLWRQSPALVMDDTIEALEKALEGK